jgi:hypothetical protein
MARRPQTKSAFKLLLWAERPCNPTIEFKLGPTTILILIAGSTLHFLDLWSLHLFENVLLF